MHDENEFFESGHSVALAKNLDETSKRILLTSPVSLEIQALPPFAMAVGRYPIPSVEITSCRTRPLQSFPLPMRALARKRGGIENSVMLLDN